MAMTETGAESMGTAPSPGRRNRLWWWAGGVLAMLAVAAAIAFAVFEPIQVLPRIRLAPGFALVDQHGETVTSEDLRGRIVLYTFTYTNCDEPCPSAEDTMAGVLERLDEVDLGDTPVELITLSFDPGRDTADRLAARAELLGADGERWRYATSAPERIRDIVGSGFRTYFEDRGDGTFAFDPTLVLVDGWGVVRGEYRYQTLTSDVDKILHHLEVLGEEIRNSHGAASLAYEAAHFFLCYP
ncbi:MAG: SCO family protein [Actinobacteria bacterium]|nr:MAG: SCO family protein [Actinomycetota bacterium]